MKKWNSYSGKLLMGASLFALAACEEPKVEAAIFESLEQCIDHPDMTQGQCRENFQAAQSQHAAVAPKYASEADCQSDFGAGRCEKAPYRSSTGGSVFMPLMMGYMMGSLLGGGRSFGAQPLYRSAQSRNTFRTANNRSVGSKTGRTRVASTATSRPTFKSTTRSRGGFGSSARRFGSAAT